MRVYRLNNKQVITIRPKGDEFLKAYSSNTPDKPRNAFVDIKGRVIVVFDQLRLDQNETLAVVERQFFGRLRQHLKTYLFLTGTSLDTTEQKVYHDLDGRLEILPEDRVIPQKAGILLVTNRELLTNVRDDEYTLFRLKHQIPVQGIDFDEELLLNIGDEEYVSYTKGCYLGQEIIARVHHRSKPPKKLTVRAASEINESDLARMTSSILDPATGKKTGFIFLENSLENL